ncbi:MAG: TIGR01777 family oxidoreductase [Chthoniobacterales bacterium]
MKNGLPLRVGVTGARGFVGQNVLRFFHARGASLVAFSRSANVGKTSADQLPEWRSFSTAERCDLRGLDAVVHLAGESVFGRWTRAKKRRILESRIEGTRQVVAGMAALPMTERPGVLVSASATGYYGNSAEARDEAARPGEGFLAEVTQQWEAEARKAEALGVRVVLLRFGVVLGRGGGAMRLLKPIFRFGLGGRLGDGSQWMSCLHVKDAAGLVAHAVAEESLHGAVNAVMPKPVRNAEFTKTLATVAGRQAIFPAPAIILKLVAGEMSSALLWDSRVLPRRALESDYTFYFPILRDALGEVMNDG